ncbi:MAG: endonuclease/exonuclease/phosphatase family protein [Bosea sp. (in: a-proteobacteria)]
MKLRLGTFNVENLLARQAQQLDQRGDAAAAMALFHFPREADHSAVQRALGVVLEDDKRQMTALAMAEAHADLWMLQEVDTLATMQAFFANYVHRVATHRYGHFALVEGNDRRGIDVAFAARRNLLAEEQVRIKTHKDMTFAEVGVFDDALAAMGIRPSDKVFQRDCLAVELSFGDRSLTLFGCHFKSMNNGGEDGRQATLPLRRAEARAVVKIVKDWFGPGWRQRNWVVLGDLNGYRIGIGPGGKLTDEGESGIEGLTDNFAQDVMAHVPPHERWTHFRRWWSEGEGRMCECHMPLDHILLSPALAAANPQTKVDILRRGLPYRVPLDPRVADRSIATLSTSADRYPRIGWDRPKASDHCPLIVELVIPKDSA